MLLFYNQQVILQIMLTARKFYNTSTRPGDNFKVSFLFYRSILYFLIAQIMLGYGRYEVVVSGVFSASQFLA